MVYFDLHKSTLHSEQDGKQEENIFPTVPQLFTSFVPRDFTTNKFKKTNKNLNAVSHFYNTYLFR